MPYTIKKIQTLRAPHTYVLIFWVVLFCWGLTFVVPVGRFDTQELTYRTQEGKEARRTVLLPESFRLQYPLDYEKLSDALGKTDSAQLSSCGVDTERLQTLLATDPGTWGPKALGEAGLQEPTLHRLYGTSVYDTSRPLRKRVNLWGTEDAYGFGVLNYLFEGLTAGDKYGSAVGLVAFILVIGGAFGILMRTGAVDTGIHAFLDRMQAARHLVVPLLFLLFSLGGAVFGMSEETIPFAMLVIPLVIAMGYDALVGVTITFVATQVGNATSWMNPFGVAVAQGIAGVPVLSGAPFRILLWCAITLLSATYITRYAARIRRNPSLSMVHASDQYFREHPETRPLENRKFGTGDALVLLALLAGIAWVVWGVTARGFALPEIASQFFATGLAAGTIGVLFGLNGMRVNDVAISFQRGASDLAGTALVVGMARGILLVLGGAGPTEPTILNTILSTVGEGLRSLPPALTALLMYAFQTLFNFFVTSNSGQAALTMPILAPLSDITGVSRQVAVLCYQLGSGFADAIVPTSASLMGVLGVARINWATWARFHLRMQGLFFLFGTLGILLAMLLGYT